MNILKMSYDTNPKYRLLSQDERARIRYKLRKSSSIIQIRIKKPEEVKRVTQKVMKLEFII